MLEAQQLEPAGLLVTYWLPCGCVLPDGTPDRSCRACCGWGLRAATADEISRFEWNGRCDGDRRTCDVCSTPTSLPRFGRSGPRNVRGFLESHYLCDRCESHQDDAGWVDRLQL